MTNVQTLKGFRDFLPETARKRQYVLETLKKVFESYGFEPLETPALEYEEILTGKYGAEGDKLMYKFKDNGKRKVAMRYDQTVPLARAITQYQNELPMPFKRYQMQNVWRAENTQKGRYREFLQVDADIVGSYSPLADAEIIAIADTCLKVLGFKKYLINVNTRELLFRKLKEEGIEDGLLSKVIIIIDKVDKIGWPKMDQALLDLGIPEEKVRSLNTTLSVTQRIEQEPYLKSILDACEKMGITNIQSKLYLARGLDYYTGLIFEVEIEGYDAGSIAGGGRYDNLIGMFAGKDIPAVGFAFGFDRLIEAMESLNLFPKNLRANDILVAFSTSDLQEKSLKISNELRNKNINAEIYLEDVTLEKQLKYADKKGIPYVLIVNKDNLILKNMTDGNQKEIALESLPNEFK